MYDFLWHGRGGQGAFTAARLLGAAYSFKLDDNCSLAFPSFGPERRGAPVRAFTKLSDSKVGDRSEIKKADFAVFLDDTLFNESSFDELKEGGKIILCTKKIITASNVVCLDGVSIAERVLGLPITNTVMLGAVCALFNGISLDDIHFAISNLMPKRLVEKNCLAVSEAYEAVGGIK